MGKEYWHDTASQPKTYPPFGCEFNLRGTIALNLIEKWGLVTGKPGPEDSSGRTFYDNMTVEETVTRAVDLADGIVTALEAKGWIREASIDAVEAARREGILQNIATSARYEESTRERFEALKASLEDPEAWSEFQKREHAEQMRRREEKLAAR